MKAQYKYYGIFKDPELNSNIIKDELDLPALNSYLNPTPCDFLGRSIDSGIGNLKSEHKVWADLNQRQELINKASAKQNFFKNLKTQLMGEKVSKIEVPK